MQKIRPGALWARFWKVLETFWASLWRVLGALGRLLAADAPLGRILGASWSLLGAFWLVLGGILALGEAPGWILKASGRVRGAILRLLVLISRCFFDARELALTYRIKGCMNCCRKPMLVFTWASRFPLQRGGTCAVRTWNWSQIGRLGLPGPSPKPPKSSLLGACAQDASQEAPKWIQKGSQGGPRGRFSEDFR